MKEKSLDCIKYETSKSNEDYLDNKTVCENFLKEIQDNRNNKIKICFMYFSEENWIDLQVELYTDNHLIDVYGVMGIHTDKCCDECPCDLIEEMYYKGFGSFPQKFKSKFYSTVRYFKEYFDNVVPSKEIETL